ncbi:hypothetical protein J584_2616 [Acinetobacter sp. 72431]|nr:hypothetical protein J584_2616 [Acinetobacter sp. 72431]
MRNPKVTIRVFPNPSSSVPMLWDGLSMNLFSGLNLNLSSVLPANFPNRLSQSKVDITEE